MNQIIKVLLPVALLLTSFRAYAQTGKPVPENARVHHRLDEALERIGVALELDPLSLPIADSVGEFLYFARRYDEAIAQFRKTLEMEPNFLASLINLGRAYEQRAMFSEAEDQFVKATNCR